MSAAPGDDIQATLAACIAAFEAGQDDQLHFLVHDLDAPDEALLLSASPPRLRRLIWELTAAEQRSAVIQHLNDDVRADFLDDMDAAELAAAGRTIDPDDFADILQQLPEPFMQQVLARMDARDRVRVEVVLSYPEDCAGGLMTTDMITVRPRHTLELVLRYLRRHERLPDATDQLLVVNSQDEFVGVLRIARLLTSDPSMTVREVMDTGVVPIPVHLRDTDVARRFAHEDLVSAPVVDDSGRLVGRITVDDVVDVIIEDAEESVLNRAGLDVDADTFAPVLRSARSRAVWLGINLLTAFLASFVIHLFENTIRQVVALAVLMPIVSSMGGIAGTQSMTNVVRGMALGQIGPANVRWLLNRELQVALINGMLWALLVAGAATWSFQDMTLGAVIAAALIFNLLVAATAGALLPRLLQSMSIDPAIAGGVILTTLTDVAGYLSFLGLATLVYMRGA